MLISKHVTFCYSSISVLLYIQMNSTVSPAQHDESALD